MPACPEHYFWRPGERRLTGNRRYRVHGCRRQLLVLQLEWAGTDIRMFSGESKEIEPFWHDARPQDLMKETG
jgi:hypothetical protein